MEEKKEEKEKKKKKEIPWWVFFGGLVVGVATISLYALQFSPVSQAFSVIGVGLASASAAFCFGSVIGFVFGIPRTLAGEGRPSATLANAQSGRDHEPYQPNTNLEQISDWLTKILVGVGLTQLVRAPDAIGSLSSELKPAFGDLSTSGPFAVMVLIYFSIGGFIVGYLWTRVDLLGVFRTSELEERIEGTEEKIITIRKEIDEHERTRAHLHRLVQQALEPAAKYPDQEKLETALRSAGQDERDLALDYAFEVAEYGEDSSERAAWLSRVLLKPSIEVREDEAHAALGVAVMNLREPDYAEAEKELSRAIEERTKGPESAAPRGLYEYYRAASRISLDEAAVKEGEVATRTNAILDDLKLVAKEPDLVERVKDPDDTWGRKIRDWVTANPDVNLRELS